MKLLNFLNQKKDKPVQRPYSIKLSPNAQTSGSDLLLQKLGRKRKSFATPKAMFRSHHGLAKKLFIIVVFVGLLAYGVYKFNLLAYFKISSVEINGAGAFVNYQDIKVLAEKNSLGQSLFLINIKSLTENLKKNFLGAKDIDIEKKYPDKLKVFIKERVPLAIIYNDEENYIMDSEGYILGVVSKDFSGLPKIKYEGDISAGSFLQKDIVPMSTEILDSAEKNEVKVSSMSFFPKYTKLYVGNGTEVYIGYDKNNEESLKTVGALLKTLNGEGKEVKKIDLRYDKLIVSYD